jgi:acetyl-CoA synthetase
MSALPLTKPENISNLLNMDQEYAAPSIVADNVLQKNWTAACDWALKDPEEFWGQYAEEFEWSQPWTKVLDWDGIHHKWFLGAKTNITINALDRHAYSHNANRAAFIWLGEDGAERIVTYRQLHRQVCRFANGLKSLGVVKGDRVIIYMPLTIEGAIAMLACARIGAIHSVVYAGLGHAALRDRITDAQAKIVIAGDVGYRAGKPSI